MYIQLFFFQRGNVLNDSTTANQIPPGIQIRNGLKDSVRPSQISPGIPFSWKTYQDGCLLFKVTGCLVFIGLLLFMAGVELNPGPITPADDKTDGKQEQPIPAQTMSDDRTYRKEEPSNKNSMNEEDTQETQAKYAEYETTIGSAADIHEHSSNKELSMKPLVEAELRELAKYIPQENQEEIALMLRVKLKKVNTLSKLMLRLKLKKVKTGVILDLLLEWMKSNPQPTNRMVNNIFPFQWARRSVVVLPQQTCSRKAIHVLSSDCPECNDLIVSMRDE